MQKLSLPGIEPGTLSVLDSCDNHYTTETPDKEKFVYKELYYYYNTKLNMITLKIICAMFCICTIFHYGGVS